MEYLGVWRDAFGEFAATADGEEIAYDEDDHDDSDDEPFTPQSRQGSRARRVQVTSRHKSPCLPASVCRM